MKHFNSCLVIHCNTDGLKKLLIGAIKDQQLNCSFVLKYYRSIQKGPQVLSSRTFRLWILKGKSGSVYGDLVGPVRVGSSVCYQMGPLMKVISYGTVPFHFRTGPV